MGPPTNVDGELSGESVVRVTSDASMGPPTNVDGEVVGGQIVGQILDASMGPPTNVDGEPRKQRHWPRGPSRFNGAADKRRRRVVNGDSR